MFSSWLWEVRTHPRRTLNSGMKAIVSLCFEERANHQPDFQCSATAFSFHCSGGVDARLEA